jgi:hypothetical protein
VNVATGSVGFVLIMTGFTLLDLLDNALGIALLVAAAAVLTATFGIDGTAVAAAVSIASVNLLRLAQVRRRVGIQPYERDYLRLVLPAGAAAAAAVIAHAVLGGRSWWLSLALTSACALLAYTTLLPLAVTRSERAAFSLHVGGFIKRRRSVEPPSASG